MDDPLTPDQLRKLLLDHLGDLEELQIIVCVHGAGTESSMTLDQLTAACALPETSVRQALERLVGRGLIATIEGTQLSYRFAPPDAATREQIERIVEQYRANPLTVIKIMASSAIERVRSAALYTFAEAFRVKRHKSDG